jgi:nucleoside-diphosphate-sugar epimerase
VKIAITGSNGFLAQYFKYFTNINHKNICFLTTSTPEEGQILCKDLYSDIEEVLVSQDIDTIIHFASVIPISFGETDYELFLKNNEMMNNVCSYSIKKKLKKFIYLSGFGSMNSPKLLDIKDFYTMSKITGEHFCSMMESYGIETASLRISAPYGEFSKARTVINIFIEKAIKNETIEIFGTGKREQNFTYAGDIVNAIELTLENKVFGTYSIVSEKNTSMLELAKKVIELTDSASEIIIGKKNDSQEDYAPEYEYKKAKLELGYEPKYTIENGLKKYIKWFIQ